MTTGSDNLGNGVAKTEDRFAGQLGYRPRGNRDGGSSAGSHADGSRADAPLNGGPRGSGPLNGSLSLGNPLGSSPLGNNPLEAGPLGASRNASPLIDPLDVGSSLHIENPIASTLTEPKLPEPAEPELSFREPGKSAADSWLDTPGKNVVDHPLLRGLLLELPQKGATLQAQWLDRWFEAARSILELLYRFEDKRD
jgi:hypothetical protein